MSNLKSTIQNVSDFILDSDESKLNIGLDKDKRVAYLTCSIDTGIEVDFGTLAEWLGIEEEFDTLYEFDELINNEFVPDIFKKIILLSLKNGNWDGMWFTTDGSSFISGKTYQTYTYQT